MTSDVLPCKYERIRNKEATIEGLAVKAKRNMMIIFSFICSFLAIGLFGFFLYITPYILFNARYAVPEFVAHLMIEFRDNRGMEDFLLITLMLLPILVGAILFTYISRKLSDTVEKTPADDTLTGRVAKQEDVAEQVEPSVIEDEDEDVRQVTLSVKATATEIVNEAGEVIAIETTQPKLVAEESKPELFETDPHIEPIIYSKSQTSVFALKLGILIVGALLFILFIEFLVMTHVI